MISTPMRITILFAVALLVGPACLSAQAQRATITGIVKDAVSGRAVDLATVYVEGSNTAAESAENGRYSIVVPAEEVFTLVFTRIGYQEVKTELGPLPARSNQQIDVDMAPSESDIEVIVRESKIEEGGMIQEDVEQLKLLPTTTGNLESQLLLTYIMRFIKMGKPSILYTISART